MRRFDTTSLRRPGHIVALIFPDPLDAMESTEEPDFEGIEEISYEELIESLNVEQKARSKLTQQLAKACDMRQELENLLQSNAGKRPQNLPGVSRQRLQELEMEMSKAGMPKDLGEELYKPRLRPCACGCGELLLGEWSCEGEVTPFRQEDHSRNARSPVAAVASRCQVSHAEQKASMERLSQRKMLLAPPVDVALVPSPKRKIDRQRLALIALPRELPPPPKPCTPPPKARPAPPRPQLSASEPALHPGAAAFLAPPRRKVVKLSPKKVQLPGLGPLLFKASLVEDARAASPDADKDLWVRRHRTRRSSAQRSYVEAHLYPKPSAKSGSLEDLEQRLQKARQERMALEKQLAG